MSDLQGACVLITGAAGGLGREMVRQFRGAGSRLVLSDLEGAGLEDVGLEDVDLGGPGEILASIPADLSTRQGCEALQAAVEARGLEVDILVNNAGLAQSGYFYEIPPERWEAVMQVNLLAPMHLVRLFVPGMVERGRGHIVNIASIAAWIGGLGIAPYNASKFGLRGFGEALRLDLADHGVRVSTVCPFFVRTPILDSPQYGRLEKLGVPEDLPFAPEAVIREVIEGVRRDRPLIFPDPKSRRIQLIARFLPGALPWLSRRLRAKAERASAERSS